MKKFALLFVIITITIATVATLNAKNTENSIKCMCDPESGICC